MNNDFSYQDCNGCDWRNKNFSHHVFVGTKINGGNLSNCKLNGARFNDAQLCGTNLTNASLCGANLLNANLNGADLHQADLTGADLRQADLRNSKLNHTNFSGANVQGAQFKGSIGLTEDIKRDFKARGAIFDYAPVIDVKWLMQYVIIPLAVALLI